VVDTCGHAASWKRVVKSFYKEAIVFWYKLYQLIAATFCRVADAFEALMTWAESHVPEDL
jgi:hypothetical protein